MYLEHLVPNAFAILAAPRCFLKRLLNPRYVSFGLMANLNYLKKRGIFENIDAVIDVGANIGQFAYMMHTVIPNKPIFSFEPDDECFKTLQETHKKHHIVGKTFSFGLSDKCQKLDFNIYETSVNNSILVRKEETPKLVKTIEVKTLDEVSTEFTGYQSFFLKIDVQGAEMLVLDGAKRFLSSCKFVLLEVSLNEAYSASARIEDIIGKMRTEGFVCWEIVDVLRNKKPNELGILEMDLLFRKAI
jgi:FkbM family methyltransferase